MVAMLLFEFQQLFVNALRHRNRPAFIPFCVDRPEPDLPIFKIDVILFPGKRKELIPSQSGIGSDNENCPQMSAISSPKVGNSSRFVSARLSINDLAFFFEKGFWSSRSNFSSTA